MHDFLELLKNIVDPDWVEAHAYIYSIYFYLVMFIIFAETGLFIGFFLPGDSLLFVTGMIISRAQRPFESDFANLTFWMALIIICGIVGNFVGYWIGRKSGNYFYERKDSLLFKKKHLYQAQEFYEKKGGVAIVLARFMPIVRTFAPIVAGIVKMDYKKFTLYNIIGSIAWVTSMVLAGYWLGKFDFIKDNLEKVIIGIIIITTGPVLFKMFFGKKKSTTLEASSDATE